MDFMEPKKHFLRNKAEEAGWKRLGHAQQNTRWLPPTGAIVSKPHVYEEEYDIKRFMRWIATQLSAKYNIKSEVQCYYEISERRIVVAANENVDIMKLRKEVNGKSLAYFFENVLNAPIPGNYCGKAYAWRGQRHTDELQKLFGIANESTEVDWSEVFFR